MFENLKLDFQSLKLGLSTPYSFSCSKKPSQGQAATNISRFIVHIAIITNKMK